MWHSGSLTGLELNHQDQGNAGSKNTDGQGEVDNADLQHPHAKQILAALPAVKVALRIEIYAKP